MSPLILSFALSVLPAAADSGPDVDAPAAMDADVGSAVSGNNGAPAVATPQAVPTTNAVGQPVGGMSLADFADKTRPAVVHVKTKGASGRTMATGTGFVVGGHVVTNQHVVEGAASVDLTFDDGATLAALGTLAAYPERDLAILATPAVAGEVTLGTSDTVRQGQRIIVLGNPQGLAGTLSEGIISAVRQGGVAGAEEGVLQGRILQITAPISPGSSGSPVFGIDGKVIGVATAQRATGQNLNFVVPVEEVSALLAKVDVNKLTPFSSVAWLNWVVSAAFFAVLVGLLWLAGKKRRPKGGGAGGGKVARIH